MFEDILFSSLFYIISEACAIAIAISESRFEITFLI
jgi:hypothetical protein